MRKIRFVVLLPILLIGCGTNASSQFNSAGCAEVANFRFDLAAKQFSLAAENGDPSAVKAADDSQRLWYLMTFTPNGEDMKQLNARLEEIRNVEKDVKFFCKFKK